MRRDRGDNAAWQEGRRRVADDLADRLDQLHADIQQLTQVTAAVPATVGRHVGGVINDAAYAASFSRRYTSGGANSSERFRT